MDISKLSTQELSEDGKWFRVELYGEKQDFWIKVLGADSDAVQKLQKKNFKKFNANANGKKMDNDTIDELLDDSDTVLVRMVGIAGGKEEVDTKESIILDGQTLTNDEASYRFLITKIPAIKKWVLDKSNERSNFLA